MRNGAPKTVKVHIIV